MVERALAYCDMAVAQGIGAIRSHVDVCDERLVGVEALLEVRRRSPYLTLQLVAFPQDGFYRDPGAKANLLRALDLGVDVVGGIPHFERTMEDGRRSVVELCGIAAERGLMVDLHCDETDDPLSRHIETLAGETLRLGLHGRGGSHLTSMHSMDNYYVSKLIPLIVEADVAAIANPLINITFQGRHDTYPKRPRADARGRAEGRRRAGRLRPRLRHGPVVPAGRATCSRSRTWRRTWASSPASTRCAAASRRSPRSRPGSWACRATGWSRLPRGPRRAGGGGSDRGDPKAARLFVLRGGRVAQSAPRMARLDLPGRPPAVSFLNPLASV